MTALRRAIVVGCLASVAASAASAQFGPSLAGVTVGISSDLPLGKLDELAKPGIGIALRRGGPDNGETWSGRSSFSYDRFPGNLTYDNIQFVAFGFDIVHKSAGAFYEFGGLGLSNARFTIKSGTTSAVNHQEQDFGLDGGVGLNIGSEGGIHGFIELSASTVFTSGENSSWFPIRLGVKF